jgi:hypothetical protein
MICIKDCESWILGQSKELGHARICCAAASVFIVVFIDKPRPLTIWKRVTTSESTYFDDLYCTYIWYMSESTETGVCRPLYDQWLFLEITSKLQIGCPCQLISHLNFSLWLGDCSKRPPHKSVTNYKKNVSDYSAVICFLLFYKENKASISSNSCRTKDGRP